MKIVAPAGNMERFYSAIKAGAEEIYMGLQGYGARRNAQNFTMAEYKEAIDYAHSYGVKIFLTMNTIMHENEMEFIYHNLKELYEYGLDAIIVQDLGLFKYLHKNFPNIEYHGSTQMTVANHVEANYLKKLGFTRVVLPRELSFEEIKKIRENTDIELEIFVSGALCISYSGNCYMSSFIGSRSGNRGMCAQACRKMYQTNSGEKGYLLSPKDQLMGYEEIQKLRDIGIESIKLEGRMKDPLYVFETVSYYKKLILGEESKEVTTDLFNRGYSKGFFYGADSKIMNPNYSFNLGKDLGQLQGRELKLSQRVVLGDGITYLSPSYEKLGGGYINKIELKNGDKSRKFAEKNERIILKDIPRGTKYIFKSYAKEVSDIVENKLKNSDSPLGIVAELEARLGKKPVLILSVKNSKDEIIKAVVEGTQEISKATNKPTSEEDIAKKISEFGDTTFFVEDIKIKKDENIFIPLSTLKSLRREGAKILTTKLLESYRREAPVQWKLETKEEEKRDGNLKIVAIYSDEKQKEILKKYDVEILKRGIDVAREGNLDKIDITSPLASNLYQLLENKNEKVIINWNLNVTNRYTMSLLEDLPCAYGVIISPEISFEKIRNIGQTKLKKGILGYSKLKGMYIELPLFNSPCQTIVNEEKDEFLVSKNELGNTEIFFTKPLNILNDMHKLKDLNIDFVVLEFTNETPQEIEKVFADMKNRTGIYRAYNYERGVY